MNRNLSWYNLNETRPYPVDDSGTLAGDGGEPLPFGVLADLRLAYPASLGRHPYLSALSVGPALVTAVVQVARDPGGSGPAVAAVAAARADFGRWRPVPLEPLAPGVAGWAAFGAGAEGPPLSWRGSTAAQAPLAARAARAYPDPPVPSLGRVGGPGLAGVVRLSGQSPVEVVGAVREVGGVPRTVALVRLADPVGTPPDSSALRRLAGPCGGRPESGSCGDPAPLETLGGVAPDCDGVVTLEFRGCADVARFADGTGAAVDCALGLAAACPPPYVPGDDGRLPGDLDAYDRFPPPPGGGGDSYGPVGGAGLPFVTCFRGGGLHGFQAQCGEWVQRAGDDPGALCEAGTESPHCWATDGPAGASQRNVLCWEGPDTTTVRRKFTAHLRIDDGGSGWAHKAGLVVNHAPAGPSGSYLVCRLDWDYQRFELLRFGGAGYASLARVPLPVVLTGVWYRVEVTVRPAGPGAASLAVKVTGLGTRLGYPALLADLGTFTVPGYGDPGGRFGFESLRSWARFSCARVEEA